MLVRNIQPGTMYRVNLPGGITSVYKTPDLSSRLNGKTIPDQAIVRAFSPVYIKPETWLPVEYPTIEGRVWIPMKDGAVKLQTMETPIFVDDTPTKPLPDVPTSPPALETPPILTTTPDNGQTKPETPQNGSVVRKTAILKELKVIAVAINALITLLEDEPEKEATYVNP